jgi:hypothetical protein
VSVRTDRMTRGTSRSRRTQSRRSSFQQPSGLLVSTAATPARKPPNSNTTYDPHSPFLLQQALDSTASLLTTSGLRLCPPSFLPLLNLANYQANFHPTLSFTRLQPSTNDFNPTFASRDQLGRRRHAPSSGSREAGLDDELPVERDCWSRW